ncbi:MAG: DUF2007 domain-containing protein [Kofleriaceae bacterium]|nr:DUF2007 domain-containing protein [Myxococcales bacterium]MCB9561538.1 DUF2007 domain-containing protein [Kofleriaceae bacterium]
MAESRIRIATCHNPADAALVRSMLSAHGIAAVVSGENHAGLLGGLAGGFISMDVWVDTEDAEQAAALIRDLREGVDDELAEDELVDEDTAEDAALHAGTAGAVVWSADDPRVALEKRRRTGAAVLLACCVTFGTAHMYTRAWLRGITLAALELVAIGEIQRSSWLGWPLFALAIATDLVGAVWRVRVEPAATGQVPTARLLPPS